VDLNEVTFIDRNGERLLRMLARDGAQFTASGIYTMRVLDQVTAKSRRNGSAPKSQGEKASPNVDAALALNTCVDAPERKNLRRKWERKEKFDSIGLGRRAGPNNSRVRPVYRIGPDAVFNFSVLFYTATEPNSFGPPRNCNLAR
jgi:hypothetical protein